MCLLHVVTFVMLSFDALLFWQWGNDTDTCEQKDILILNACEDLVLSIGSIYK